MIGVNEMKEKKVGLITGGGTGTGRAIALGLAKRGIDIVINYSRSVEDAEKTAAEVRELGVSCLVQKADVANDEEVRTMVENAIGTFGRLDYVVNSAGITVFVDMADLEGLKDEHWDKIMDVNVKGIFHVSRATAKYLKQTRGSIVSKAAAICLTKSLARVLAPEVRVNSVAPGIILTRWVAGREEHVEKFGKEKTPLGRVCYAEDVADVVIPLLTSSSMMTGQTIVVDGGMTL